MQVHTRFLHLADEETRPLPAIGSLDFQSYLDSHALSIRDVALAARVRLLVVWNIVRGNPVLPGDAGRVRAALFLLTREHYRGPIPVRVISTQPLVDEQRGFTRRLVRV